MSRETASLIADTINRYSEKYILQIHNWKFLIHPQPKIKLSRKFKSRFTFIYDLEDNKNCKETSIAALKQAGILPESNLQNHGGQYLIVFYSN